MLGLQASSLETRMLTYLIDELTKLSYVCAGDGISWGRVLGPFAGQFGQGTEKKWKNRG